MRAKTSFERDSRASVRTEFRIGGHNTTVVRTDRFIDEEKTSVVRLLFSLERKNVAFMLADLSVDGHDGPVMRDKPSVVPMKPSVVRNNLHLVRTNPSSLRDEPSERRIKCSGHPGLLAAATGELDGSERRDRVGAGHDRGECISSAAVGGSACAPGPRGAGEDERSHEERAAGLEAIDSRGSLQTVAENKCRPNRDPGTSQARRACQRWHSRAGVSVGAKPSANESRRFRPGTKPAL